MVKEIETLKELGLEEREAKIYLALLPLGNSTATLIAEEVGIDRTTTYDLLNRMIKKGIVSYIVIDGLKYFSASPPNALLINIQEKESQLKSILPDLIKISKKRKEKTTVETFKGRAAVGYVTKMILEDRKDYLFMGAGHEFCDLSPIMVYKFVIEARRLGLKGKLICEEGFGGHDVDIVGKNEIYRLISKEFTSTTTQVWGNKTAFFLFEEPYYTILIENKEIANRHRLYFDYLWKQAKEPTKLHKRKTLVKD